MKSLQHLFDTSVEILRLMGVAFTLTVAYALVIVILYFILFGLHYIVS